MGSKTGFNLGKGYFDLGQYSTHGGSSEVVKENLYRIAKENATRSGGSSIQKGYDMKTTGKQEEKGGMVPLNQRSISYES